VAETMLLKPVLRSPLDGWDARLAAGSVAELVTLREEPIAGQINLRVDPADGEALDAISAVLGHALPLEANRTVSVGERRALWLGPNEWLAVLPLERAQPALVAMAAALEGRHAAVTDLSANRTLLRLSGPKARAVLEKGCGLDLHPRMFGAGRCAQTDVARTQVILDQLDEQPSYRLHVRRSFAAYLAAWLLDAMAEWQPCR
jgi:sarcosine oxidase subunit gamma